VLEKRAIRADAMAKRKMEVEEQGRGIVNRQPPQGKPQNQTMATFEPLATVVSG
jgi:hypothetical protein